MDQKSRNRWKRKCDTIWYELQHRRHTRCSVCGSPRVEIHHLIPKNGHAATRTAMENGIGLCPNHHRGSDFSAHGTPRKWERYLEAERPSIWNWIVENRERVERVDWKNRYQELKSEYDCIQSS